MSFSFDKGPYRHRRDWPDASTRLAHIHSLIDKLLELEHKTAPASGAEETKDKDFAAFKALQIAGGLVDALAGWAIDHQIGLALSGLKFVPRQPSGTRNHPKYLRNKATADSHEHEAQGSDYFDPHTPTEQNPQAERQMLANLLERNPGGFPLELVGRAVEALKALEFGETQDVLRPEKTNRDRNAYTRWRLELRALAHVEYLHARGIKKLKAFETVGEAYGRDVETVRKWGYRLRKDIGNLEVSRALSFARNSAGSAEAAKRQARSDASAGHEIKWFERQYGEEALEENAAQYKAAVDGN